MSQGTPAAPALPLEILLSRLAQFSIPRGLCEIFRKDTTFQQFQLRCQQISYVRDLAEREHNIPISINALARIFDCPRRSVQSTPAHGLEPSGEPGKHSALEADREQQILDWIQQKAEQSTPIGKTEIKDYCTTELKVPIARGWVNSFVLRHSDQIFKTKSTHQEQQRLQVPRMFLERTVQDLKEHI
jgi:transposase